MVNFNKISEFQIPRIDFGTIKWPRFDFSGIPWSRFPRLRIGDSVARLPIIQGGMGVGISLSGLASAVANEGGIGVIAANSIGMIDRTCHAGHRDGNVGVLRREIRKAKENTRGLIGVNIMVAVNDFHALLNVAIKERADMVFLGAGLPIKGIPVEALRSAGVKVVPIVSSARAAGLIFKVWMKKYQDIPDAVVVEGPKAGGHLGFKVDQIDDPDFALEQIVPEVVSAVRAYEDQSGRTIPVIAAGGIFTGADIYRFFKLGASGVQMGTRFVGTYECDADIRFKEAYIACREEDIKIIRSPVGMPGRAIENQFLRDVSSGERKSIKCAWRCLRSCDIRTAQYCISAALDNARRGILEKGFAFAGSNAFRIEKIISVKELLQELKTQYLRAEEKGVGRLRTEYESVLEKLVSLKKEYGIAVSALRDEYEMYIEKGIATLREEYLKSMDRIRSLKDEYMKVLDDADTLKEELNALFERYALLNRTSPEAV